MAGRPPLYPRFKHERPKLPFFPSKYKTRLRRYGSQGGIYDEMVNYNDEGLNMRGPQPKGFKEPANRNFGLQYHAIANSARGTKLYFQNARAAQIKAWGYEEAISKRPTKIPNPGDKVIYVELGGPTSYVTVKQIIRDIGGPTYIILENPSRKANGRKIDLELEDTFILDIDDHGFDYMLFKQKESMNEDYTEGAKEPNLNDMEEIRGGTRKRGSRKLKKRKRTRRNVR